MRKCIHCEIEKPVEDFDVRKDGKNVNRCKECRRAAIRKHYTDNKQYYVDKASLAKEKVREAVRKAKSVPCVDCGNSYPYYVMDFDHLGDKSFNISEATGYYSFKKIKAEIDKCEVVCSNCHRIRTWERKEALALKP